MQTFVADTSAFTGSTVTIAEDGYDPGIETTLHVAVFNGSSDDEWIVQASLDFPPGVEVVGASNLEAPNYTLPYNGAAGDGAEVSWGTGSGAVIFMGQTGEATVTVVADQQVGDLVIPDETLSLADGADLFFGVAAVADYRPRRTADHKLKKGPERQQLELVSNPDIIAEVAALEDGPLAIGFAAETEQLEEHAREKLSAKRLDMIAANLVGRNGCGFEAEENEILLVTDGEENPSAGAARGNWRRC